MVTSKLSGKAVYDDSDKYKCQINYGTFGAIFSNEAVLEVVGEWYNNAELLILKAQTRKLFKSMVCDFNDIYSEPKKPEKRCFFIIFKNVMFFIITIVPICCKHKQELYQYFALNLILVRGTGILSDFSVWCLKKC